MIRKISVGVDYKSAMHYIVNQEIFDGFKISDIVVADGGYDIYVKKDGETRLWKHINKNVPVQVEFNLNY